MSQPSRRDLLLVGGLAACAAPPPAVEPPPAPLDPWEPRANGKRPLNLVVILTDDLRADALGFAGSRLAATPRLDALARSGVWMKQSFVTTSLCSPSRATLLSGLYAHQHGVLDNQSELSPELVSWPALVRRAGFHTAYVGKWHMGGDQDGPRPHWDHWVSFPGQGHYHYPGGRQGELETTFNFNGERRPVDGYVTDRVTDLAIEEIQRQSAGRPFALVIGHKAVHAPFEPAERHRTAFADAPAPPVLPLHEESYVGRPEWLRRTRDSAFGAEKLYGGRWPDFRSWYLDYYRTLLAVDEGVGRVVDALADRGLLDQTLVVFTSDNGFMQGERGILDKRCAYEESIRVPLVLGGGGGLRAGTAREELVLNLDLAPTLLDAAGLLSPEGWSGRSLLPLARGEGGEWRQDFLYEYFFERIFPQFPTVLALRTQRAKLVTYHGVWERNELYLLDEDPGELHNRIDDPAAEKVRRHLWRRLNQQIAEQGCRWNPDWGRLG